MQREDLTIGGRPFGDGRPVGTMLHPGQGRLDIRGPTDMPDHGWDMTELYASSRQQGLSLYVLSEVSALMLSGQ